jgi:hypothetical protein
MSESEKQVQLEVSLPMTLSTGQGQLGVSQPEGTDKLFVILKSKGQSVSISIDEDDRPIVGLLDDRGKPTHALSRMPNGDVLLAIYRDGKILQTLKVAPKDDQDFGQDGGPPWFGRGPWRN